MALTQTRFFTSAASEQFVAFINQFAPKWLTKYDSCWQEVNKIF